MDWPLWQIGDLNFQCSLSVASAWNWIQRSEVCDWNKVSVTICQAPAQDRHFGIGPPIQKAVGLSSVWGIKLELSGKNKGFRFFMPLCLRILCLKKNWKQNNQAQDRTERKHSAVHCACCWWHRPIHMILTDGRIRLWNWKPRQSNCSKPGRQIWIRPPNRKQPQIDLQVHLVCQAWNS